MRTLLPRKGWKERKRRQQALMERYDQLLEYEDESPRIRSVIRYYHARRYRKYAQVMPTFRKQ